MRHDRVCRRGAGMFGLLAAVLALLLLPAVPAGAADNPLAGGWTGTYRCGAATPFTMTLKAEDNGLVSGELHVDLGGGKSGSYHVRGRAAGRQFTLVPMDWIERPANVSAIGLRGEIHPNGLSMEGRLNGCSAIGQPVFAAKRDVGQQETAKALTEPPRRRPRGERRRANGQARSAASGPASCRFG